MFVVDGEIKMDPKIIMSKSDKIQIIMVSHVFTGHSGHMGVLFIYRLQAYYYDSNGLKDVDEKDYYDKFGLKLYVLLQSNYNIEYIPYVWNKGIQVFQGNEESKYKMHITGMCCAWSYLMVELKLLNPELTVEAIENKIKNKYKNRLTRYIVTYHQMLHPILFDFSKEIFNRV
jgi:hypothetical protein